MAMGAFGAPGCAGRWEPPAAAATRSVPGIVGPRAAAASVRPAAGPTLAVGVGQTVQVHARGRILAAAVRHGRGWSVMIDGRQHETATLEGVLVLLNLLPTHRR